MAAAMTNLRAQTAGNVFACSNIVRDLSQNSHKRDVEATCLQVQRAPKQLHSLKSSSLRSTSYKQDSSWKLRNSSNRITSVLEAQGTRTTSKHEEIIKNPSEALMERFGNRPSSDITRRSVTESADRLFLWESIPKLGMNSSHVAWQARWSPNLISDEFELRGCENGTLVYPAPAQIASVGNCFGRSLQLL
jgi:hypothetical protein